MTKEAHTQDILCYSDVIGHERAKMIVSRALATNRVPHAYLFRGPGGVGKKLFARGLAAALNCRNKQGTHACGVCVSCKKMRAGSHPDYMVIEPEKGAIKIDQVRKVCRELSYSPYESATRIVVLEDIHTMRREAANSLLKTLEEPPENNVLILTSESAVDILSTVSSRCQVVPFYGLTDEQTSLVLGDSSELLNVSEQNLLGRLAEGSPGKGLVLEKSGVLGVWSQTQDLLLRADHKRDDALLQLLHCAEELAELKDDITYFFSILRLWLRDHLFAMYPVGKQAYLLDDWNQATGTLSWGAKRLHHALALIDQAEKELLYNCNITLVCEVLLFKLMQNECEKG